MLFKGILMSFLFLLFSCRQSNSIEENKILFSKETIDVEDIVNDYSAREKNTGEGVRIQFLDKRNDTIVGLTENDTFFVRVDYISDKFTKLARNHEVELFHAKGNFHFLGKVSKNKYKLAVGFPADTISFDVVLKSDLYNFNDYYLKDGEIVYELVEKILLCRSTQLPFSIDTFQDP